uniref:Prostaglandin E synthase 3 like n=1 Tax=Dicentrarchus labrax TaxID=13489 RepID=A0A8C4NYV7_DICLA
MSLLCFVSPCPPTFTQSTGEAELLVMGSPKLQPPPEDASPAHALWFDRKKYVTVNFMVHKPKDVQCNFVFLFVASISCFHDVIYNELYFYDKVLIHDSRERVYDRSIHVLLRKIKPDFAWPRLQRDEAKPSWIAVDFDNWRDWEHEEDEGQDEFYRYADMIQEMTTSNKGAAPDMGDLSDVSARSGSLGGYLKM